jgi:hypothetical protein
MARTAASKTDILGDAGYAYNVRRQMYINREAKKAFSVEFVEDNPEDRIRERVGAHTDGREWVFYFNRDPSDTLKHELECVLG